MSFLKPHGYWFFQPRSGGLGGLITGLLLLAIFWSLFILAGCQDTASPNYSTGIPILPAVLSVQPAVYSDTSYTLVDSSKLAAMQDDFNSVLSREGLVRWDERFRCAHFADLFIGLAQARNAVQQFQSSSPGHALALAVFWYRPAGSTTGHAIVEADTERGQVFWEPQTGQELHLSQAEISSRFFAKY